MGIFYLRMASLSASNPKLSPQYIQRLAEQQTVHALFEKGNYQLLLLKQPLKLSV